MSTFPRSLAALAATLLLSAGGAHAATFTVEQATAFPFVPELVSAPNADRIAWIKVLRGVRNVWVADGPGLAPRQVTQFTQDDGQELTQLTFSPDGKILVFVRGGDHDANWPAKSGPPNPNSSPVAPTVAIWLADPTGVTPARKLVEGDEPALSSKGELAFTLHGQVWTATLDGKDSHRLFYDRGQDAAPAWSPDGARLAFVSNRGDHAFVGVYVSQDKPLKWLAPTTGTDFMPTWSPDGSKIAYVRLPGDGGPPASLLKQVPQLWSIWTADVATGAGHLVWKSPETLRGTLPDFSGAPRPHWAGNDRLTFLSEIDNWPHLYVVPEKGGEAKLLTPGAYMAESAAYSRDGKTLYFVANTGATKDDEDRRHLFKVSVDGGAPVALTHGEGLEWSPAPLSDGLAFIGADVHRPATVEVLKLSDTSRRQLDGQQPEKSFPGAQFVTPKYVSWTAPDGLVIHGQLFETADGPKQKPAVIFVHGGPPRQMLLGWSYMDYYSNAYAMNQYLAAHGFVVLSVNYRLGIGYGFDFQHPEHAGWQGASEYQDVLAAGRYLQGLPQVDGKRVGIWGGSYGGLLTALALARNSDVFKAGVDLHGVHDISRDIGFGENETPPVRYEKGDLEEALAVAFKSSAVADADKWTSPVLFIHGDDDRNVHFNQTVDMVRRLRDRGVAYEELVLPDDIHGFLLYDHWIQANSATADFLARKLGAK